MGLFDKLVNSVANEVTKAATKVVNEAANSAANSAIRNIKESGVIESTVDDIANSFTGGTKFAKIMICKYCKSEYDNTLLNCPNCGAPNENRKYDYQQNKETKTINHLLNIGDKVTDGTLTFYIADIKGDKYITTLSQRGSIKTPQDILTVDEAIQEGSFRRI